MLLIATEGKKNKSSFNVYWLLMFPVAYCTIKAFWPLSPQNTPFYNIRDNPLAWQDGAVVGEQVRTWCDWKVL